jgi:flagellar biogenesis protein FliO
VASILLLDALVLAFVYALIWGVDKVTSGESEFFRYVKIFSHGIGLLLYMAWACWDTWEFVRDTRNTP